MCSCIDCVVLFDLINTYITCIHELWRPSGGSRNLIYYALSRVVNNYHLCWLEEVWLSTFIIVKFYQYILAESTHAHTILARRGSRDNAHVTIIANFCEGNFTVVQFDGLRVELSVGRIKATVHIPRAT